MPRVNLHLSSAIYADLLELISLYDKNGTDHTMSSAIRRSIKHSLVHHRTMARLKEVSDDVKVNEFWSGLRDVVRNELDEPLLCVGTCSVGTIGKHEKGCPAIEDF